MRAERFVPVLFTLAIGFACSGNDQTATVSGGPSGGTFNATMGVGAGPGAGGSFSVGGSLGAGGSAVIPPDAACATGTSTATLGQLTMFVMFDDSGSMADNNKWANASSAMRTFFSDPGTNGMKAWLRLFPSDTPMAGCTKAGCSAQCTQNCGACSGMGGMCGAPASQFMTAIAACSQPQVPLGALTAATGNADPQERLLLQALAANATLGNQDGGTPMSAALQGVENAAAAYAQANPNDVAHTVVVLVTDGEPNGCDENIADIAKIAADGLAATTIKTYAIGLQGSQQADMDAIAMAGGTQAVFIGNAGNTQQDLLDAFGAIQSMNAACDFDVPAPPAGQTLDPALVNVNYTAGNGTTTTFGGVSDAAACGTNASWYYNATKTHITLCDAACTTVKADPGAKMQVLFGCSTACDPSDPNCNPN